MLFEKLLLNVGLVVLGLLAGIITVEVTLRLANYNPQISTDWQLEPSRRVLDTDLIMTHPKFFHPEYYSDTNDNLTIIALGDSFTIGYQSNTENEQTANADTDFTAFGVSYAVSDELSVSYGISTVEHENSSKEDQDAAAVSFSYVTGGMTISGSMADVDNVGGTASVDNSGYELNVTFAF